MLRLVLVAAVVSLVTAQPKNDSQDDDRVYTLQNASDILERFDAEYTKYLNNLSLAQWNYHTNMTDENRAASENAAQIPDLVIRIAEQANAFPWKVLEDEHIKRQFNKLIKKFIKIPINESSVHGFSFEELGSSIPQMEEMYNTAKICDFTNKTNCDLALNEVLTIMKQSRNPEELKYTWVEWKKTSNKELKLSYPIYVMYANINARRKNFSDQAAYWISDYEADDFPDQIETLWQQLKPLYLQLHAYVRRELRKKYGEDIVSKDGPIPAHLLGNIWPQSWSNIADFTAPFPRKQMPNVTTALLEQGYNATGIFRLAEDFYKSINLSAMPDTFWERSILEKQEDVEMSCVPKAWDFYDGKDFRISQCTRVDMESLLTAHHEMAHVEYAMQYKDQPAVFKMGANPAFQEAIANALTLMVPTPKRLKKIGLLKNDSIEAKAFLNRLYLMSLDKIAFMPFAYMMERWRWNVFQGNVTSDNYNCHWWSLATEYQGIEPPVDRSEEDFDPGPLYNIFNKADYLRHFVSQVLQFQIHRILCVIDFNVPTSAYPLHKCDIYGNQHAGKWLKRMLQLGSSKPWPDVMGELSRYQMQMDAVGILEYFQPLKEWLRKQNKKTNEYIGWKPSNKRCVRTRGELTIRSTNDEL